MELEGVGRPELRGVDRDPQPSGWHGNPQHPLTPSFHALSRPGEHASSGRFLVLASRLEQLDYLRTYLSDENRHALTRAHAPVALVRSLRGFEAELSRAEWQRLEILVTQDLTALLDSGSAPNDLVQGAATALGLLDDGDEDDVELWIHDALIAYVDANQRDSARCSAVHALGRIGGRAGRRDLSIGSADPIA